MKSVFQYWILTLLIGACASSSFAGANAHFEADGRLTEIGFTALRYTWSESEKDEPRLTLRFHSSASRHTLELLFCEGHYDANYESWRFLTDLNWGPEGECLNESGLFRALPSALDLGAFSEIRLIEFVSFGDEDLIAGIQRTNRLVAFSFSSDVYIEIEFHPEVGLANLRLKLK